MPLRAASITVFRRGRRLAFHLGYGLPAKLDVIADFVPVFRRYDSAALRQRRQRKRHCDGDQPDSRLTRTLIDLFRLLHFHHPTFSQPDFDRYEL